MNRNVNRGGYFNKQIEYLNQIAKNQNTDFTVLIIGSDINAYYMARCYYELKHQKAIVLAKEKLAFTHYSKILKIIYNNDIWHEKQFINCLNAIAKNISIKKIFK